MPRYFFHVIDGVETIDNEGTVLAIADEARAEAIVLSSAMLSDAGGSSGTTVNGSCALPTQPATRYAPSPSQRTGHKGPPPRRGHPIVSIGSVHLDKPLQQCWSLPTVCRRTPSVAWRQQA